MSFLSRRLFHRNHIPTTGHNKRSRWLNVETLERRETPAAFGPANYVVYRVGDGSAALSNAGTPVFLDEYTPTGVLVQTIPLPGVFSSGTATSEGFISLSENGKFLGLAGYSQNVTSVATTTSAAVNRTVSIVDSAGVFQTYLFNDYSSGSNARSAVPAADGKSFWMAGNGSPTSGSGVRYGVDSVSMTSTQLLQLNARALGIFGGQLYVSSAGTRVVRVGSGLPTTTGQSTVALNGDVTTSLNPNSASAYGFYFADLDPNVNGEGVYDTLYIADDAATTPGIRKFSFSPSVGPAGTWEFKGFVAGPSNNMRSLTGHVSGNCVTLVAINSPSGGGTTSNIVTFMDKTGYGGTVSGTAVDLVTGGAGLNKAFRGVAFTPQLTAPPELKSVVGPGLPVSSSANYTLTFNVPVSGLTAANLALTTVSGDAMGTIGTPMNIDGFNWSVPINGISGNGQLRLDMVNQTGVAPPLFFLPFNCGTPISVVNVLPDHATLDFVNGEAIYYGGALAGVQNNNVTVNGSGLPFGIFISETVEPIFVTPAAENAGWKGGGTSTVFTSDTKTTSLRIRLENGSDDFTFNGNSFGLPMIVVGGSNPGDVATLNGTTNTNGAISVTGFDSITQGAGGLLGAGALALGASSIGNGGFITTKATTVTALAGSGGVFLHELDGAGFTLQATDTGPINVMNDTGVLAIVGDSKFGSGDCKLDSGDGVSINAALGDNNSSGLITINANSNGSGADDYVQSPTGKLITTNATIGAIYITVNTALSGNGNAVLGVGSAGANSTIIVDSNAGNILWNDKIAIPAKINDPAITNLLTLNGGNFNFNTNGPNSGVGSAAFPIQVASTAVANGRITVPFAGTGGVYVTEWGSNATGTFTEFTATAAGGNIQLWTGTASNNSISIVSPGVMLGGTGSISLRADDATAMNADVGGPGFGGTIKIETNLDGSSSHAFIMNSGSISTTSASANAVEIVAYSQTDNFQGGGTGGTVGGIAVGNITVGNGGTVILNANGQLGFGTTDAKRAGAIVQLLAGTKIDTGVGTVILTAKDNSIGGFGTFNGAAKLYSPLEIVASTITASTNSTPTLPPASTNAGDAQKQADINIIATGAASFSATTTTAGTNIGTITLSASGSMGLHGNVKTDDGPITLSTPGSINQTAGAITTLGKLSLNYAGRATLATKGNDVGDLAIPELQDLRVNGDLKSGTVITIAGGTLSGNNGGVGRVSAVKITESSGAVEGKLTPGNSPGILATGDVMWSGGSRFGCEISGGTAGTGYDQLQVTGTVDIGNASLDATDPTLSYTPAPGAKHFIILNDGIDPINNKFKGLLEGATVSIGSTNYTISYVGNGDGGAIGNDVVLIAPGMATPPPTLTSAPLVNSVVGIQRSIVNSLKVSFSEAVNFPSGLAAAFKLNGYFNSVGTVGLVFNPPAGPASDVTITFNNTGSLVVDPVTNSLPDGKYELTIVADKISGAGGTFDGNGNMTSDGSPTDDVSFKFHRLFGDGNGSGNVDGDDFALFRGVFGVAGPTFDFNGNGNVGGEDFAEFRKRFGLGGYLPP